MYVYLLNLAFFGKRKVRLFQRKVWFPDRQSLCLFNFRLPEEWEGKKRENRIEARDEERRRGRLPIVNSPPSLSLACLADLPFFLTYYWKSKIIRSQHEQISYNHGTE